MEPQGTIYVRTMRASERDAVRDLTLAAYEEFAAIMPAQLWTGYRRNLLATLDTPGPADRIVAERQGLIVGSVLLFPPAANAYPGAAGGAEWPEVRLLAVLPSARGQGVGIALMAEDHRRLHRPRCSIAMVADRKSDGRERAPQDLDFEWGQGHPDCVE